MPAPGDLTVVFATSTGEVDALAPDGYVRWRVQTGQLAHPCPMLAGYGVTGTPVADPVSRTLYLVDAFGRMHALDLATGAERPGWPVTLYTDYRDEIEWGALALADGYVYAGTGTYCDQPAATPLYRVSTTTREVTSWTPVPRNLGGGGGIWGWGGVAYSAARDSLYVVTGNAIQENETAGYGERLVELSPSLRGARVEPPGRRRPPRRPRLRRLAGAGGRAGLRRARRGGEQERDALRLARRRGGGRAVVVGAAPGGRPGEAAADAARVVVGAPLLLRRHLLAARARAGRRRTAGRRSRGGST